MPKSINDLEIEFQLRVNERNARLRTLISTRFSGRGMFRRLREASGISELRWKNFFYQKQDATEEMLSSWREMFPADCNVLDSYKANSMMKLTEYSISVEVTAKAKELGIPKNLLLAKHIIDLEKRISDLEKLSQKLGKIAG